MAGVDVTWSGHGSPVVRLRLKSAAGFSFMGLSGFGLKTSSILILCEPRPGLLLLLFCVVSGAVGVNVAEVFQL